MATRRTTKRKPKSKAEPKRPKAMITRICNALEKAHGIQAHAARIAGVSRQTVWKYVTTYPECAEALEQARESLLDEAESKLRELAIDKGQEKSLMFLLKTIGKGRGYTEKTEVDLNGAIEVVWADPEMEDLG